MSTTACPAHTDRPTVELPASTRARQRDVALQRAQAAAKAKGKVTDLRKARWSRGLTLDEAAKQLCIDRVTLMRAEVGGRVSRHTARRLEVAFGVPVKVRRQK